MGRGSVADHDIGGMEIEATNTPSDLSDKTPKSRKQSLTKLRRFDSLDVEASRLSGLVHHGEKALTTSLILRFAYESIGVVYGDVGTSPLYVYSSTFPNGLDPLHHKQDILGALSLIIYSLTLIPLIKYVLIVLKANDHGEGGTFALYSLISRYAKVSLLRNQQSEDKELSAYNLHLPSKELKIASKIKEWLERSSFAKNALLIVGLLGTSMVIGDGVLTPAISVLSAVDGVKQAASSLNKTSVVLISLVILVLLFLVQRFGTSKVGFAFAPAVLTWFTLIGSIGFYNIIKHDTTILKAFYPKYIYDYFIRRKREAWISLGGIVLAITGTEAMFADLGHFSVPSIQIAFSFVVYPCLLLAYIGQGAYLSDHPEHVSETFYKSIPKPLYWPMFVVAVAAAIIASQAMISATFTVVKQSMALGCFPRVKVVHTSSKVEGQVYIPELNWILMIACLAVTGSFQTTEKLGNAYGIAVVGVMVVTTSLITLIMIMIWQKNLILCLAFLIGFGFIDLVYFSSVLYKFDQGGYLPLAFAAVLLFIMYVWQYVSAKRYSYEMQHKISLEALSHIVPKASRVPGIGLVYTELAQGIPGIFAHMVDNLPAIHAVVVFVTVKFLPVTSVLDDERFLIRRVGPGSFRFYRAVARYGYRDVRQASDRFEEQLLTRLEQYVTLDLVANAKSAAGGATKLAGGRVSFDVAGEAAGGQEEEGGDAAAEVDRVASMMIISNNSNINYNDSSNEESVEEELRVLSEGRKAGVVYLMGHSDVRAAKSSSFLNKLMVDYFYDFLRKNSRRESEFLIVPSQKLLKVGMVYHI